MPSTDHDRRDALPVGTVLRDFTIQAVIGHGGFGVVYRAGHNDLELTVAIKEYLPVELALREGVTVRPRSGTVRRDFEDGLRRFRDEAQALIDFDSHPSIVSCRDFFRASGTAYMVMEYEDGHSLAEVLATSEAEGRPFTESDLLAVMTPLLEGLARVHAAGVLHRDIKPSNILIRRDRQPVLIDFGAAKQMTAKYSKSQAPYTEGYAALEQVADTGKLGPWTDMYGVGAVMWRMVAGGKRPWEPPHPVRVELRSHAALGETKDPLPLASELGKGRFPPQLLATIDQCLELRETERVQSASELLDVLQAASDQSPTAGPAEADQSLAKRSVANRQQRGSRAVSTVPEQSAGWRKFGLLALASLVVGLGLVLPLWWDPGSAESVEDQGLDAPSGGLGGEITALERGEAFDTVSTPNWRLPNRESTPEAEMPARVPDATDGVSDGKQEDVGAEFGRDVGDSSKVRLERSRSGVEQPWIRDWDALGDIQDPGFAATAQAYIARYDPVPEASVWVAKAEGLLAELRELEVAAPTRREAGELWTNSLGMEFVWIPPGNFLMGSPEDEEGRPSYKPKPQQELRTSRDRFREGYRAAMHSIVDERRRQERINEGFWIKQHEVTQGEWEAVMGTNPSRFSDCGTRCPVDNVSWFDTEEFVQRLNGHESSKEYRYRLPTEVEWEYAARAGTTGARYGELGEIAWYRGNSGGRTHPVGLKRANAWGLHDMLGNVWEWTRTRLVGSDGEVLAVGDVIRGGDWSSDARRVRSAVRDNPPDRHRGTFGFRLVRIE